jgi:putative membrane protein
MRRLRISRGYRLAVAIITIALPAAAWAHGGEPHGEHLERWTHWNADLWLIGMMAMAGGLYAFGLYRMSRAWQRVPRSLSAWRSTTFFTGIAALVVALLSPLDAMSDQLSAAHMVQHMILITVAAPLLVLGAPGLVVFCAMPMAWRRAVSGAYQRTAERWLGRDLLRRPLALWFLHALVLWVWHLPVLYEAALHSPLIHEIQHIAFLASACLFWRVLLDPVHRLRLASGPGVIYLFTTSLHATALGVLMALSPLVWYPTYEGRTAAWNLSALDDQQLAGLIMWMPACMVYAFIAAVLFAAGLRKLEKRTKQEPAPCPQPVSGSPG